MSPAQRSIGRRSSAVLLAGTLGFFPFSWPSLPPAVARVLYNVRERMAKAIAESNRDDAASRKQSARTADTALRLAPQDALTQYDTGTLHLRSGDAHGAAALLEQATHGAAPNLASAAAYNLGNARHADHDLAGAVSAYRQALRVDPGNQDAKFNLELALREQESAAKSPTGGRGAGSGGDSGLASGAGSDRKSEEKNRGAADPGQDQKAQADGNRGQQNRQGQAQPRRGDQPLPQFRDQPDMTAAEAAALLESVENLERAQRRAQAAQRAERRTAKGKDW